jgi:hypothetical protein
VSTDVRTLLHDLAADAPRGRGEETADLVVDLHRAQDRRRLRWAGVAAAIAVVVAVVPALVDRSGPTDASAVASGATAEAASLFDAPTRGSLADDPAAVAAAVSASWEDGIPYNDDGDIYDPAPQNRHAAFVGEVPSGQVWALVIGRTGPQLSYAWFIDPNPADGLDLVLVGWPGRTMPGSPLALVDVAGGVGPMLVVAMPGDEVPLVPFADTDPEPDVRSVEAGDGTTVAVVGSGRSVPGYEVVRDDVVVSTYRPEAFDSSQPLGPFQLYTPEALGIGADPEASPQVAVCMVAAGWQVTASPDGTLSYGLPLSQAQVASFQAMLAACRAEGAAASAGTDAGD